jgi:APA family basic amino acid/polyamine antiporter
MKNESSDLKRVLGLRYVVVVVIANIIGSGVYKKVAPMASELGSAGWVLIAWILGGIITLFGALSNAEVAGLLADTGGDYVYYKKIYNRFLSFIYGWSLFTVIQTAAIASLAWVFSQSLNNIFTLPELFGSLSNFSLGGVFYPFQDFSVKMVAILLILGLTWVNTKGIKTVAGISNLILLLVFLGIFIIIAFGLTSSKAHILQSFSLSTTNSTPVAVSSVFTAMLAAFWGYQGWASIGFIGGEVKDATKNVPKGIAIGVFIVIAIYLAVNVTYLSLLPVEKFKLISSTGNQIAAIEAVREFWGYGGAMFISVLILITTLSCTHATILASARPYYAMAKEGLFFRPVAKLNSNHVPQNSLIYQGIWACILVMSGTFDQLTDMIIFAVFIYYGATAFGVFILRRKMPDANRPYKVWGYPVVPAIVVLFCIGLIFNTFITRPREASIGLILMLTGIPMYLWFMKKKRKLAESENDQSQTVFF